MKKAGLILILALFMGAVIVGSTATGQSGSQELILEQGVNDYEGVRDTTIYSEGGLSNGGGDHVFTGVINQGAERRTLMAFDLSDVPEGATIRSAKLELRISRVQPNVQDAVVHAHRLTSDWGEGTTNAPGQEGRGTSSQDGDANWEENFQGESSWETQGGDFRSTSSASSIAARIGSTLSLESAGLIADVQFWVDNPDDNFGWVLRSDGQARRYNSSNNTNVDEGLHPRLTITFTTP